MTALFLAPHNDDETLFGSFLIQAQETHVLIVLASQVQEDRYGITAQTRESESRSAVRELAGELRPTVQQWRFLDSDPAWDEVRRAMIALDADYGYDPVFAPAIEEDGHEHHNRVGALALEVFGDRVVSYLTYTRSGGRSRNGTEVVPEPDWVARKHRALACYRSQIAEPSCAPWFLGDLREYVA